jgi:small basic protein (TIGR04137 family)
MGDGQLYIRTLPEFEIILIILFMSQHNSLKSGSGLVVKRNVLKRFERVEILKKRGQWKAGDRVQGLRKTKPDV